MPAGPIELSDVTVSQALQRLDSVYDAFTSRFLRGDVSLWVGSRVSDDRYPNLWGLLTRLLNELYDDALDPTDPDDTARQTIDSIVARAGVPSLDMSVRFSAWPKAEQNATLEALVNQYSAVFMTRYAPGGTVKDLVWDLLKVDELYDDPNIKPDAEHRLVALLVTEGVLTEVVTPNWDPLLEDAHAQVADGTTVHPLRVVIRPTDFENTGSKPKLTKMHGCARAAHDDPADRRFLVATDDHILHWMNDEERKPIREHLSHVLRCNAVLYIGLSGQDVNIQSKHVERGLEVRGDYSPGAPRVLFSGGDLDDTREAVLRAAYGADTYNDNYDDIRDHALVTLYAKPLLAALYLCVLREKLRTSASKVPPAYRRLAEAGVDALVEGVASAADSIADADARWRFVSSAVARYVGSFVRVYREGAKAESDWDYTPFSAATPEHTDPVPRLALLVGILTEGQRRGYWTFEMTPDAPEQLRLHVPTGGTVPVYIVCDNWVSPQLPMLADAPLGAPYVVFHATGTSMGTRAPATPSAAHSLRSAAPAPDDLYLDDWTRPGADPVDRLRQDLQARALAA